MRNIILVVVLCIVFSTVGCAVNHRKPCHANYGSNCYGDFGCHSKAFIMKHDKGLTRCALDQIATAKMWDEYFKSKKK